MKFSPKFRIFFKQMGHLIILHGYTIPKCIRSFNEFIIRDGADATLSIYCSSGMDAIAKE